MKLIDADRLKREIATIMPARIEINLIVDAQPDAVIRCKDCKNSSLDSNGLNGYWCSAHTEWHNGDWFCADGERK